MKKLKIFKYLGSLVTNQNSIQDEINVDLKQEIHVIIQKDKQMKKDKRD